MKRTPMERLERYFYPKAYLKARDSLVRKTREMVKKKVREEHNRWMLEAYGE